MPASPLPAPPVGAWPAWPPLGFGFPPDGWPALPLTPNELPATIPPLPEVGAAPLPPPEPPLCAGLEGEPEAQPTTEKETSRHLMASRRRKSGARCARWCMVLRLADELSLNTP